MAKNLRTVRTVGTALDTKTHTIGMLRHAMGTDKTEALIKLQFIYLNELLSLKNPLTEAQIDEIAAELVDAYPRLSMADVHLIMNRAKTGHYGSYYERLSMPLVLKWFKDYFEERCEEAERRSMDMRIQNKEWNDTTRKNSSDREREAFSEARSQYLFDQELKRKKNK